MSTPVLTKNRDPQRGPLDLRGYQAAGGYSALRLAVGRLAPGEVVSLVAESGLRGRGGAGFPTGRKWSSLPPVEQSRRPRVLLVNFDEMEPGTFKDRFLVEGDPHQLVEGTVLAAYACQADLAYIFVQGGYVEAARALRQALGEARDAGYIGADVLGSGWGLDVRLHTSAGRYICGEETGLVNALEGRRPTPRTKPPYVVTSGAWGRPTVVNNVETLCCVPHIIERGPAWFRSLGAAKDAGTKVYGVSGRVKRPGCFELPMGTPLRELLDRAGGMCDGYSFRAALPGGASTMFLDESQRDVPLDYQTLGEQQHALGTGCAVVLDDKTCVVGMVHNLVKFFARESCGWCTPCREGLPWVEAILHGFESGRAAADDIELLEEQAAAIGPNTFCALATGAMFPVRSSLRKFRGDYEAHISQGRCPWREEM